jgi:hypothetical protein
MYCSTCGAFVREGNSECTECGAARTGEVSGPLPSADVRHRVRGYGREDGRWVSVRRVGTCPRCGYRGEGITYFSKGTHAAALIGLTILTAGAMGLGGLIYFLVRREHRVCPRCGLGWGRYGESSRAPTTQRSDRQGFVTVPPASRERSRRTVSVLLFLLAAVMTVVGFAEFALPPLLIAGFAAAGGFVLNRSANHEREKRRTALIGELQPPVLRLARELGGRLTVTQVASSLGWTMARAEKILTSLDDGLRVDSEVTDEGVIVYNFLEIIHGRGSIPGSDPETRRRLGE